MQNYIKVKKKEESSGLGLDEAAQVAISSTENWWHDSFAENLKSFKLKKKKGKKKAKKDSDEETKQPTFDELFLATGGARLGMRARANQTGKLLRTETDQFVPVAKIEVTTTTDAPKEPEDSKPPKTMKEKKRKRSTIE